MQTQTKDLNNFILKSRCTTNSIKKYVDVFFSVGIIKDLRFKSSEI